MQNLSQEWRLFLGNIVTTTKQESKIVNDEPPYWIPEQSNANVQTLRVTSITCFYFPVRLKVFIFQAALPELYDSLKLADYNIWKDFMEHSSCETHFPAHCSLKDFQKVLVVQMLRPDRLHSVISMCVLHLTGKTIYVLHWILSCDNFLICKD